MAVQDYVDAAKHYIDEGTRMGQDIVKKAAETVQKVEALGEDISVGTAIGAAIPILGELGIGEAIGAFAAGLYGVFDNWGGDIMAVLNPPAFGEDDYNRMRRAAIDSGAIPHPGVAPDNYGGCVYPDGSFSGGDWPFPGTWNWRDRSRPPQGDELRDETAYQAHANAVFGNGAPAAPADAHPAVKMATMKVSAAMRGKVRNAILAGYKKGNAPPPAPMPHATPPPAPGLAVALKRVAPALMQRATELVRAAAGNDQGAKEHIAAIVDGARKGDSGNITEARIITAAQRMMLAGQFVRHYLAIGNSRPMNTGRMQITGARQIVGAGRLRKNGGGGGGKRGGKRVSANECAGCLGCPECDGMV